MKAPGFFQRLFGKESARGRWEAAKTTRLNESQWGDARGNRINQDIAEDGPILWRRCQKELSRNPTMEGIIETYVTDIVGRHGPTIAIESDSDDYNTSVEQVIKEFFKRPDVNRKKSFAEFLEVGIRNCWVYGDLINLIIADPSRPGPVKFSLQDIQPSRVDSPWDAGNRPDIICGIEVAKPLRPVAYHVMEVEEFGAYGYMTGRAERIPAEYVLHWYRHIESEQVRGIPWMAVALQVMADLREYDNEVLDCARAAADTGVYLHTQHPDAPFVMVNETYRKERRQTEHVPPGWTPMQIRAEQPTTNYVDYRTERQRDMGRAVSMPVMLVRLDASRHNYSSARFDGQRYQRGKERTQYRLTEGYIDPLVDMIVLEAERAGAIPMRPRKVDRLYTWPVDPHVDPDKEAKAQEKKLANLTMTLQDALATDGKDLDEHLKQLKKQDADLRAAIGIGLIEYVQLIQRSGNNANGDTKTKGKEEDDEDEDEDERAWGGNGNGRFSVRL